MKHCKQSMIVMGSCLSTDQTQVLTTWFCNSCFKRVLQKTPNPRYVHVSEPTSNRYTFKAGDEQRHICACGATGVHRVGSRSSGEWECYGCWKARKAYNESMRGFMLHDNLAPAAQKPIRIQDFAGNPT